MSNFFLSFEIPLIFYLFRPAFEPRYVKSDIALQYNTIVKKCSPIFGQIRYQYTRGKGLFEFSTYNVLGFL